MSGWSHNLDFKPDSLACNNLILYLHGQWKDLNPSFDTTKDAKHISQKLDSTQCTYQNVINYNFFRKKNVHIQNMHRMGEKVQ